MLPKLPAVDQYLNAIRLPDWSLGDPRQCYGRLTQVGETQLHAVLPWARLGEVCYVLPQQLPVEVVAIRQQDVLLSPLGVTQGLTAGQWVLCSGKEYRVAVGDGLLGCMVDGLGRKLSGPSFSPTEWRSLHAVPPEPMTRRLIDTPMPLGVRAIDGLLTCGIGQRMGIFAAAGGGKSTLLSMICAGCQADVLVLALVGERGREVREFVELTLPPAIRQKSVLVVSTSERPALERLKACWTATTIAEYFRDQGKNVLLLVDSLTRHARAAREVGLMNGEPALAGGYPPSVFAQLPRLLERAGPAAQGSITAFYTVLVAGDDHNEPLADEIRSLLDGHIVLSHKLAAADHYPAIDIAASISRIMPMIASEGQRALAGRLRHLNSLYQEIELLVRVGEYQSGQDRQSDEALYRRPLINQFLRQRSDEYSDFDQTLTALRQAVEG
ncbi:FliI/YscN family ATPase [Serratia quinivorans]|uniref:FliI/YscN family ATPase n=1 Tax=Serratia quinivorans TaxID=137545 RepID=UPI00217BFAAF|nr:FliI/YscN family ATPase [Serratia quinivorans]CAI1008997.1 Probable ATP synthase YscN [Serratia quinivorans]CAI1809523.1 Probable ATP synthase YscN [Serratia quinivorans]